MPSGRHRKDSNRSLKDVKRQDSNEVGGGASANAISREPNSDSSSGGADGECFEEDNGARGYDAKCCSPLGCMNAEQACPEDCDDSVRVECNNTDCPFGKFMHKLCFDAWEEHVLHYLRSTGRARSWSEKQRHQNLWTKKGYDLAYKACDCLCGRGHLCKDLNYSPTKGDEEVRRRRHRKKSGGKQLPSINTGAGAGKFASGGGLLMTCNGNTSHSLVTNNGNVAAESVLPTENGAGSYPYSPGSMHQAAASNGSSLSSHYNGQQQHFSHGNGSGGGGAGMSNNQAGNNSNGLGARIRSRAMSWTTPSSACSPPGGPHSFGSTGGVHPRFMRHGSVNGCGGGGNNNHGSPSAAVGGATGIGGHRDSITHILGCKFNSSAVQQIESSGSIFARRDSLSKFFEILPKWKVNGYHIKMEDDCPQGNDDTRCFILTSLGDHKLTSVPCVFCRQRLQVYDRYPLIDGTFFLSLANHANIGVQVKWEGDARFLLALCMGCLGRSGELFCRRCGKAGWFSGDSLQLGTMYTYDVLSAFRCSCDPVCYRCCAIPGGGYRAPVSPGGSFGFFVAEEPNGGAPAIGSLSCLQCGGSERVFVKPLEQLQFPLLVKP